MADDNNRGFSSDPEPRERPGYGQGKAEHSNQNPSADPAGESNPQGESSRGSRELGEE